MTAAYLSCTYLVDPVNFLRVGRRPPHADGGGVGRLAAHAVRRRLGHALFRLDRVTVREHSDAFVVVRCDLHVVILPSDQILYEIIPLGLVGYVLVRPRAIVVAFQTVSDDVSQDVSVPVFL